MANEEIFDRVSNLYNYVQAVRNDLKQVDDEIERVLDYINKTRCCTGCKCLDRGCCVIGPGNHCIRRAADYYEKRI